MLKKYLPIGLLAAAMLAGQLSAQQSSGKPAPAAKPAAAAGSVHRRGDVRNYRLRWGEPAEATRHRERAAAHADVAAARQAGARDARNRPRRQLG